MFRTLVLIALIGDAAYIAWRLAQIFVGMIPRSLFELKFADFGDMGSVLSGLATVVLAWIAWQQLSTISAQQRMSATLQACDRYDTDLGLRMDCRRLRRFLKFGDTDSHMDSMDVTFAWTAIFNYFDAIAIGLKQDMYDPKIACDHIGNILRLWVERLQSADDPASTEFKREFTADFKRTTELCRDWDISTAGLE